jgi:surface carbohydrate biosynthesis protein
MNIYLHIELTSRELDSKLLLAILAALKGHQVLVSSHNEIMQGFRSRILAPGIFHTKSLTPGSRKLSRHQSIIDNGSKITSQDEEHGLHTRGYEKMARNRYSNRSIGQASAVFGWGSEDTEALKKIYPDHLSKIHKVGSPRADLWKPFFSNYWNTPKQLPKKPFLLISSNLTCSTVLEFHEVIQMLRNSGYFKTDPDYFRRMFHSMSNEFRKLYAFIEAIQNLAKNNKGYDIVLRPHPMETIEAWKVYLEGIPNVHIIREGPINEWVNKAFAVMHNSCTTAIEATISEKPLVTYIPFENEYDNEIPNLLGDIVKSPDELVNTVNNIFDDMQSGSKKNLKKQIPEILNKKIHYGNEELAAQRIIKVWESLEEDSISKSTNWTIFQILLKVMSLKKLVGSVLRKLFPKKFLSTKDKKKFTSFEKTDISERVNKLQILLKINKKIDCKILSDRTILIKLN